MEYNFPGNIRELKSIIHSAANLAEGKPLHVRFLPEHIRKQKALISCRQKLRSDDGKITPLAEIEKEHILRVYGQLNRNKSRTARELGIGLNTLRRKLKNYSEI